MNTVTSKDGTKIAYRKQGNGAAVVLVDGALTYLEFGPNVKLAEMLAKNYTVYTYNRRGRGESEDLQPWSKAREIEDLEALIDLAGGSAYLYGISSGGALAMEAAGQLGKKVKKLAVYEIPFYVDSGHKPIPGNALEQLKSFNAAGKRNEAVKYFMSEVIGFPKPIVALFPLFPGWKSNLAVAHTLIYDLPFVMDHQRGEPLPEGKWKVTQPTLVSAGGKSQAWMINSAKELAGVLPNATYEPLPGQGHVVKAEALAPMLTRFFN